ncbi:QsdR family transcriptional regulator [Kineococcus sp. G2]|uniref:QsdR family transcriptional regulator n=1 Tax=Kineococcus sp. G2 TaxID=3127484 RepID=UPI00301DCDDD
MDDRDVLSLPLGRRGAVLVPTELSRRLAAGTGRGDTVHAFRLARRTFIAGERLDVGALAAQLGVDRTSLFRWVGNRDALLSELLWSLAEPTLDRIDERVGAGGAERVVQVLTRFTDALISAAYFRAFLHREPVRALKLLTTAASEAQRRFTATVESLLVQEEAAGRLALPLPAHDLAYLLVRVAESFTYADLIAGERPDTSRAAAALALVMRTDPPRTPPSTPHGAGGASPAAG